MIREGRFAATLQERFVVFLIGMRINRPLSDENVYVNMPALGLGKAGVLEPARKSAMDRLKGAGAHSAEP
jgi:hypothetical protein